MQVVIIPNGQGGVRIIHPVGGDVLEYAHRFVPASVPYLLVDTSALPTDRTNRDAWEADFSNPDGYGEGA